MNKSTIVALVAFLFAAFTLTGCNVAPKTDSRASFALEAKSTKQWFETNVKGFDKQLGDAGGYILFPSVGQAGVGFFGGTLGRGAVYNASGEQVGWAAMSSGSVGLQLGAQAVQRVEGRELLGGKHFIDVTISHDLVLLTACVTRMSLA